MGLLALNVDISNIGCKEVNAPKHTAPPSRSQWVAELVGEACSLLLGEPACPLWLTLVSPSRAQPRHGTVSYFHTSG